MRQIEERYLKLDNQKIEKNRIFKELEAARYSAYLEMRRGCIREMAEAIAFKLESYDAEDYYWISLKSEPYVSWIIFESYRNSETKRRFDVHLLSDGRFVAWDNKEELREPVKGFDRELRAVKELNLEANLEELISVLDCSIEKFQYMLLCVAKDVFDITPKIEWYTESYPPPETENKSRLAILLENFKSRFA